MDAWLGPWAEPTRTYHTPVSGGERAGVRAAVGSATGDVASALAVEAALATEVGFRGAYRATARRLYTALRERRPLRVGVVDGRLVPQVLVHMSEGELALYGCK
ncbi:hypothetical protein BU14_0025s0019 [Porphyra umbilicalis]|uniref:Uncharacterized protein n=1 Tax=Porphyra umbilicalis TaxID=2786 RepID=A0A1X6PJW2_PORUM|nr:hypothetical protein BU14_0025s0019 [Porphyra umbilicalis]|eukprot:OSX81137.1 hypothetical protein BU14_0025s0019 [Porphyra umbilicalis]